MLTGHQLHYSQIDVIFRLEGTEIYLTKVENDSSMDVCGQCKSRSACASMESDLRVILPSD